MHRLELIQSLVSALKAKRYLEIGVDKGNVFLRIKVFRKVGVDPAFDVPLVKKMKWIFRNFANLNARYYQLSSDEFFSRHHHAKPYDVIFIDGLHTFQQSLRDALNGIKLLKENGVLVMHDCCPPNQTAAAPADSLEHARSLNLPGWKEEWCGEVWKTICYLRAFRDDLHVFVLDCDYGLGVIRKGAPESQLNMTEEEINNITYENLMENKKSLLNLKTEAEVNHFLSSISPVS